VTDISSKGSLPQLTDVLYLLTDSQELVLLKVQSMRTEFARSIRTAAERTPFAVNASPSSDAASRVPVVAVLPPDNLTLSETATSGSATATTTATLINACAEGSELVDSSPSITESSSNRSYNFFDELDQLLADLEGPDTAP
jgi:hypothetical protein